MTSAQKVAVFFLDFLFSYPDQMLPPFQNADSLPSPQCAWSWMIQYHGGRAPIAIATRK